MSFRDALAAAHARIAALEAEVAELRRRPLSAPAQANEALRLALQGQAEAERVAAKARLELAKVRADCEVRLAELEHRRALAAAEDEAEDACRDATNLAERRQLELQLEQRTAELSELQRRSAARVAELEGDIEALLRFDRDHARAHYAERAQALRDARATAERSAAELRREGDDALTAEVNKAVTVAWTDRVTRLDEELGDLEALIARIS